MCIVLEYPVDITNELYESRFNCYVRKYTSEKKKRANVQRNESIRREICLIFSQTYTYND